MFELTTPFLVKLLLFILILFITSQVLRKILKDKVTPVIIGLSIAILSIVYITPEQIEFYLKFNTFTGAIILLSIPFLIAFFFVYLSNMPGVLRKIFLVFYWGMVLVFLNSKENISQDQMSWIILAIIFGVILLITSDSWIKTQFNISKNLKKK